MLLGGELRVLGVFNFRFLDELSGEFSMAMTGEESSSSSSDRCRSVRLRRRVDILGHSEVWILVQVVVQWEEVGMVWNKIPASCDFCLLVPELEFKEVASRASKAIGA